jgi:hypothetical protein
MNVTVLVSPYVEGCLCRRRFNQDSEPPETGPPGGLAGVVPRRKDRVIINGLRHAVIIADNGNRKAQYIKFSWIVKKLQESKDVQCWKEYTDVCAH